MISATSVAQDQPTPQDRAIKLDGTAVEGHISSIDGQGNVRFAQKDQTLQLQGLRRIERPAAAVALGDAAPIVVTLIDGSRVNVTRLTYEDEAFQAVTRLELPISLPVEAVQSVQLSAQLDPAALQAAAAVADGEHDTFLMIVEGKAQKIEGIFESLDEDTIVFEWQQAVRRMPRAQLQGLVLAPVIQPPPKEGRCRVALSDGSSLWAHVTSLSAGKLQLVLAAEAETSVPWDNVTRMTIRSPHMVFLSDLDPTRSVQEAIVTLKRPWRRDLSVEGRPLVLDGRRYDKGLGVHARTLLTFDTQQKYTRLAATIGIDAETKGRGDCEFVVRGDGREMYRQRVRGGDGPREIRLDITDIRHLTLLVEPGADLDLADHADWCDARLIRTTP